jgi:hypothetical protein
MLTQELAKVRRESADFDRLWRETWRDWLKKNDQFLMMREDRNLWRGKWKHGAFEMDAATMERLAEQEDA